MEEQVYQINNRTFRHYLDYTIFLLTDPNLINFFEAHVVICMLLKPKTQ